MPSDGRRAIAIKMLEEWAQAAHAADWWNDYANKRPIGPLSMNNYDIHRVADVLAAEANSLREEILMLMGVDDTPADDTPATSTVEFQSNAFQLNDDEESDAFHFSDDPFLPSDEDGVKP